MNPVFVFLVILAAVCVWVMLSGVYKYIGGFFEEMVGDVKNEMTTTDGTVDKEEEIRNEK